jgi:hypothetical protein
MGLLGSGEKGWDEFAGGRENSIRTVLSYSI